MGAGGAEGELEVLDGCGDFEGAIGELAGVLLRGFGVIGPLELVASRIVDEAGDDAEVGDGFAGGGGDGVDSDEGLGKRVM